MNGVICSKETALAGRLEDMRDVAGVFAQRELTTEQRYICNR